MHCELFFIFFIFKIYYLILKIYVEYFYILSFKSENYIDNINF